MADFQQDLRPFEEQVADPPLSETGESILVLHEPEKQPLQVIGLEFAEKIRFPDSCVAEQDDPSEEFPIMHPYRGFSDQSIRVLLRDHLSE